MSRPARGPVDRAAATAGFVLVLVVAAWARLTWFARTLAGGEALAVDGDSHYHVRRIAGALRGELPILDPLMNWPHGGIAPWADGFDRLGAAFAWIAGGGRPGPRADLAILLWPVVLGVLAVWATIELARRLVPATDRATPLAAGLAAALVPHFVEISSFGNVDHHVAEALSVLLLACWAMRRFPLEGEALPAAAWELAGALAVAFALLVFVGGQLYVGIAVVPLAVAAATPAAGHRLVGSGAPALLGGAALAALASWPALAVHGRPFTFAFPSLLQPGLVAIAGAALAATAAAGRASGGGGRPRPAVRVLAGLGVAAAILAVAGPVRSELLRAVQGWLLRQDPWIARIGEFQPLVGSRPNGGPDWKAVDDLLGPFGLLAAPALPVAVLVAARLSRARAATFAWWTGVLAVLSLLQLRFVREVSPLVAVSLALALRGASGLLARTPVLRPLAGAAPLLVVAGIVGASPGLRSQLAWSPPRPLTPVHQVLLALRLERPPVHGRGDGVLAPWDLGHAVLQVSGRPVAANGFGPYLDPASFEEVQAAFRGDEARLVRTMERLDLGWVLGGGHAIAGHQARPGDEAMLEGDPPVLNLRWMRRTPMSQLLIAGSGLPAAEVPQMERLMPVAASEATAGGVGFPLPLVWAYELVPGARITGRADPGALVTGEIELAEWGRPHRYRAWTRAGAAGDFTLRVAVPSGFGAQAIRTGPAWRLSAGGRPVAEIAVPERAVREGLEVRVP